MTSWEVAGMDVSPCNGRGEPTPSPPGLVAAGCGYTAGPSGMGMGTADAANVGGFKQGVGGNHPTFGLFNASTGSAGGGSVSTLLSGMSSVDAMVVSTGSHRDGEACWSSPDGASCAAQHPHHEHGQAHGQATEDPHTRHHRHHGTAPRVRRGTGESPMTAAARARPSDASSTGGATTTTTATGLAGRPPLPTAAARGPRAAGAVLTQGGGSCRGLGLGQGLGQGRSGGGGGGAPPRPVRRSSSQSSMDGRPWSEESTRTTASAERRSRYQQRRKRQSLP